MSRDVRLYNSFFHDSSRNETVKELKSIHICQSYHQKTAWVFYASQCTINNDAKNNLQNTQLSIIKLMSNSFLSHDTSAFSNLQLRAKKRNNFAHVIWEYTISCNFQKYVHNKHISQNLRL